MRGGITLSARAHTLGSFRSPTPRTHPLQGVGASPFCHRPHKTGFVLRLVPGRGNGRRGQVAARRRWRAPGARGFVLQRALGFVRAFRERVPAQRPQLLEAAGDLPALLGLVAAHGVEALEVEGGQRVGLLPLEAGLGRAELGGGVEQRDLDPLGALALPERDRHAPRRAGPRSRSRAPLGHQAGGQLLQLGGGLVLEHEVLQGGEAVLERVAGGAGLAFGRDRAARAGAVAAGGLDLGGASGGGGGHGGRPAAMRSAGT